MSALLLDFAGAVALKGALLLACALIAAHFMKGERAAQRHRVLSLALLALLGLPLASLLMPAYAPQLFPAAAPELEPQFQNQPADAALAAPTLSGLVQSGATPKLAATSRIASQIISPAFLFGLLFLGTGVFLAWMASGWLATRRLLRGATPLTQPAWRQLLEQGCERLGVAHKVQLFQGAQDCAPLTFGILRPIVLLPPECADWPVARRRLVLLHELAHIKRQDCLHQLLAQLACALHWFNPLAWRAERLLRQERELAADALVLASGVRPSSYASELLAVARSLSHGGRGPAMAVAMASSSQLESRLLRILDPRLDLRPLGWRFKGLSAVLAIGLLLPLGALHGWAGVPADSRDAERTLELLRSQVESQVTSLRGERPAHIELTLDLAAQSLIEQELEVIQQQFRPTSASIVALDPRSGAVLGLGSRGGSGRNLAVEQTYEPASTLKVFSIAAALDAGTIRPEQSFSTENGSVNSSGQAVRDATPAASLTVADILARSSNIGSIKIYRTLGKEGLVSALHRFHFGESPNVRIPAAAGTVAQSDWTEAQVEGAAFGQGMSVSPLQLAAAFAAVANRGIYHRPTIVRQVLGAGNTVLLREEVQPEQVLKPATAQAVLQMLEGVVHRSDGTGTTARLAGWKVAGKTGTGKHTGLFIGAAPATEPRLVLLVVVDGPEGAGHSYFGSTVAAPSFRRIAEKLLPRLQSAPTKL